MCASFKSLVCIFVIIILSACGGHEYPASLLTVDSLSMVRPDSAIMVLRGLEERQSSFSVADSMYFRLLKIKVSDKLYVKQKSDHEILEIVKYYENGGDPRLLPLAYCYAGRVSFDMNKFSEAFDYYNLCLGTAEMDRDIDLVSLVCSQMGRILQRCKLPMAGVEAYQCAYRCDVVRGNVQDLMFDLRDIAICYYNADKYDSAYHYFSMGTRLAEINKDTMLLSCIRLKQGSMCINLGRYDEAERYFDFVKSVGDSLDHNALLELYAKLYSRTGRIEDAFACYEELQDKGSIFGKHVAHEGLYRYYTYMGDKSKADYHLMCSDSLRREIREIESTENIAGKDMAFKKLFVKGRNDSCAILISAVFLLAVLCITVIYLRKRKFSEDVTCNENAVSGIMKKKTRHVVDEDYLFESSIYQKLHSLIHCGNTSEVRMTENDWQALDDVINRTYVGFKRKIFLKYDISQVEYRICMLIKINVSVKYIGMLTNMSVSSVTNVRTRLYKKFFGIDGKAGDTDKFIRSL